MGKLRQERETEALRGKVRQATLLTAPPRPFCLWQLKRKVLQ